MPEAPDETPQSTTRRAEPLRYYADDDGDGWGQMGLAQLATSRPAGTSLRSGDCDDTDPTVHPDATERVGTGTDEDCDGTSLCYVDQDHDRYRVTDGEIVVDAEGNGRTDGFCLDRPLVRADWPVGDCDDTDRDVHPGADEVPGDGIDQDCDGRELCFVDADGDGSPVEVETPSDDADCDDPGEALAPAGPADCDDTDPDIGPHADESPERNGVDEDCDGWFDEGGLVGLGDVLITELQVHWGPEERPPWIELFNTTDDELRIGAGWSVTQPNGLVLDIGALEGGVLLPPGEARVVYSDPSGGYGWRYSDLQIIETLRLDELADGAPLALTFDDPDAGPALLDEVSFGSQPDLFPTAGKTLQRDNLGTMEDAVYAPTATAQWCRTPDARDPSTGEAVGGTWGDGHWGTREAPNGRCPQ